jgi:DNA-directed RNA polymerase subunit RPC12/RpoP
MKPCNHTFLGRAASPEVTRYLFRLDEIIYLTPTVRAFLLESICLRLDLQGFARYALHLLLEEDGKGNLAGRCPYCGSENFLLNKSTGAYHCSACERKADLFALTNEICPHPSAIMNDALIYLSAYTKVEAERKAVSL